MFNWRIIRMKKNKNNRVPWSNRSALFLLSGAYTENDQCKKCSHIIQYGKENIYVSFPLLAIFYYNSLYFPSTKTSEPYQQLFSMQNVKTTVSYAVLISFPQRISIHIITTDHWSCTMFSPLYTKMHGVLNCNC